MYKNKEKTGRNNCCGYKIAALRKKHNPFLSQRALANELQDVEIDLDKNAIQRIESGKRFVTDIELRAFAEYFKTTMENLMDD